MMELRESSTMRELSKDELGLVGGGLAPIKLSVLGIPVVLKLGVVGNLVGSLVIGLGGVLGGL